MFVSLRYELEPRHHLYHCEQHSQQQQQQEEEYNQPATATEWTSFYRTSSYNQRYFQQLAPVSTSPYLDYCNTVVPAHSWRQLNYKATSTSQSNDCRNQQMASCSSGIGSSRSGALWTDNVNSMHYDNSRRCFHDYHALSDVQRVADTASWYVDDLNAQRPVIASDNYYQSTRSQTAPSCQHQTPVVCDPVSRSAQRSEVQECQSSSQADVRSELVDSGSSRPNQSSDGRQRQRRTKEALVPLIIRAILSSADVRLSLADICRYIEQHSVDYAKSDDDARWHNNVRHTLSHYEFFVKCGRVPTGRGNYWTVHPVCRAAFAADDLRIKRARHAVQLYEKNVNVKAQALHS